MHIFKLDFALAFFVHVLLVQKGVYLRHKSGLHGLVRAAAVLEPGGVVVIFQQLYLVGKAEGRVHFHLVIGLVLAVAPFGRGLAKTHRRQAVAVRQLFHIVLNALLVKEIFFLFALGCLVAELERDARVHHGLPLDGVQIIFHRHIDVGEHLAVRLPAYLRAGFAARRRLFMQTAHVFTLLKIQVIMKAVAPDIRLHPLGRILRGAQAKAVQA